MITSISHAFLRSKTGASRKPERDPSGNEEFVCEARYPWDELARPISYFLLIVGVFVLSGFLLHGDFRSTADLLSAKPISLVVLDAPGANADSGIVRKLSIRNLSVRPVEIFGVSATCSVNPLSQASSTINPFGVFEILVWVGPMKEIARNDLFVFTSLSPAPLRIDVSEFSGAAGKQKVHGE